MLKIPRYALFSFLCTSLVFPVAQARSQETVEEPTIKAEFTVYSLNRLENLNYLNGDRMGGTPLEFFSSARSPVYEYEGLNPIVFFRETPAPTPEDPNGIQREKVAEVSLPPTGGEFLFIFFPDSTGETERYRVYPLSDSKSELPTGTVRLFNATPYELRGKIGGDALRLSPGPSRAYRVNGNSISLGLGFQYGEKFHMSYNGPVELESDARGLFMVFPPFVKGSAVLQTRYLRESEPEPEPEAIAEPAPALSVVQ